MDVFAVDDNDLGHTNVIRHTINAQQHQYDKQQGAPPVHIQQEVTRLVGDMLSRDIIEHSTSHWSSPVILVKKKDGSMSFCIDYRRVNSVTKKDAYPLPHISDTLDTLAGFTTLDLLSGYWQVMLDEQDKEKTLPKMAYTNSKLCLLDCAIESSSVWSTMVCVSCLSGRRYCVRV